MEFTIIYNPEDDDIRMFTKDFFPSSIIINYYNALVGSGIEYYSTLYTLHM